MRGVLKHVASGLRALAARLEACAESGRPASAGGVETPSLHEHALSTATLIAACRRRRTFFQPDYFFGEPYWDMLLDLFAAGERRREVTVAELCDAARIPSPIALRYIARLETSGDVIVASDAGNPLARAIAVSDAARERMLACLDDLRRYGEESGFDVVAPGGRSRPS
jgi:hypothetical protein